MAEARPPLTGDDPMIYLSDAARLLDVTPGALRKAMLAKEPRFRGLHPHTPMNPSSRWLLSRADVEDEARRRGRTPTATPTAVTGPGASAGGPLPPLTAGAGLSTDEVRVQLLQGDYVDSLKAQLAEKESRIELLERLVAEKDSRLTERDEQIASLRRRVRALADVE